MGVSLPVARVHVDFFYRTCEGFTEVFVISGGGRVRESIWKRKNKSENSGEGKLSRRRNLTLWGKG